ncbi:hypothetical protein L1049_002100 [Liquidambar formosana]|uniref:Phospholipid scramblase n=1 Tax=Liquidambar formosana TaxID=63359 RepID=A0AAP0R6E0_LIQFO
MNWIKGWRCFAKNSKSTGDISQLGGSRNKHPNGILHPQRGSAPTTLLQQVGFGAKLSAMTLSRSFGQGGQNDPQLDRDFLVQLWIADRKMQSSREKRKPRNEKYNEHVKPVLKQPPLSQSVTGFLEPASNEEVQVAPLLARSNLLITRDIEWANLVLGFEQENRYAIVDVCYPQSPVGFIREQSNVISRQLLRLRRPFVAYITDAMGNELFRVRRPFWWITSSIYAEINGKVR